MYAQAFVKGLRDYIGKFENITQSRCLKIIAVIRGHAGGYSQIARTGQVMAPKRAGI